MKKLSYNLMAAIESRSKSLSDFGFEDSYGNPVFEKVDFRTSIKINEGFWGWEPPLIYQVGAQTKNLTREGWNGAFRNYRIYLRGGTDQIPGYREYSPKK